MMAYYARNTHALERNILYDGPDAENEVIRNDGRLS